MFVLSLSTLAGRVSADVIIMQNGDRITGDIKGISGDDITIEPEYSDAFQVDATMAASIESDRDFEITLDDGREVIAQLRGADSDGNQVVVSGDEEYQVPLGELVQVAEPEDYFDWGSTIDWNTTINRGNTDSDVTRLAARGDVKIGDHRHLGTVTLADEELAGVKTKDQDLLTYSYNWLFSENWFFGANASYERDPIRELDHRLIVGAGLGRDIWDFYNRTMSFEFGLGSLDEELSGMQDHNSVGYWIFRFTYDLDNTDVSFYHNHQINHYLSGRDNTFIKTSTGARYEITDLFYATMSLNVDYESDPAPGREKEDTSLVFGVGFDF
jgi:putative salt-induced outer membrane protein YdiY